MAFKDVLTSLGNKFKKHKRIFIILFILLLTYIFFFGKYGLVNITTLKIRECRIERQITLSNAVLEALKFEKQNLENDTTYIKTLIKQSFGMIKEGEKCTLRIK